MIIQYLKIKILSSKIIFSLLNRIALFCSSNFEHLNEGKIPKNIKNVAIIFNKKHFNPDLKEGYKNEFYYLGSVVWARFFYEYFSRKYKVTYLDIYDDKVNEAKFDLVIGLASKKFKIICKSNKNAYKILFAVNSHPYLRNKIIINECKFHRIPLILMEVINPFVYMSCIKLANHILLLGNDFTKNTYVEHGVDEKKITTVSGMVDLNVFKKINKIRTDSIKIIYPAGYNGVRKGILRFAKPVNKLLLEKKITKLNILGDFETNVRDIITNIFNGVNDRIIFSSKLSHNELVSLLSDSDIAVLISLEEGMVYSILESIACGCIPLVSKNCGITLPDEYIVINPYDEDEIYFKINNLINNFEKFRALNDSLLSYIFNNCKQNDCKDFLDELFRI